MNRFFRGLMSAAAGLAIVLPLGYSVAEAATAKTLKVVKSVEIAAAPSAVWDKIKNFDSLHTWHPAFASDEIVKGENNKVGAVRKLTVKDGPTFNEELLAVSNKGRNVKYKIIDPAPVPVTNYVSAIKVKAGKQPNTSVVTWQGSFKRKKIDNPGPEENDEAVIKFITGVYDAGLGNLKKISETK